ncbi:MAG TPA: HAD family hydrolase [Thermoanaerobaculia bacterium]|nr:HAD family hydrolase [Thermoanaerobaculia bacterium]
MPRFDVVTFDCYGTLIDWETGIRESFARAAASDGVTLAPSEVLAAYAEIEPAVEAEAYRSYRDVLAETASRVAQRLGWRLPEDRRFLLAESLPSWRPFPDTNPALRRLASAGCRLGILSNIDDDLLAETRRLLEVSFEPVVTAAQVRSYKPASGHFLEARRRLGPGARWLHAAQSYFHDVEPCKRLGIPVAWINRGRHQAGHAGSPDWEMPDLARFADWMESAGPAD